MEGFSNPWSDPVDNLVEKFFPGPRRVARKAQFGVSHTAVVTNPSVACGENVLDRRVIARWAKRGQVHDAFLVGSTGLHAVLSTGGRSRAQNTKAPGWRTTRALSSLGTTER